MRGIATPKSKWSIALYVVAAITVLLGATRAVDGIGRTENFAARDLLFVAEILSAPVILASILCAMGAAVQYLFDIRAVVLSDPHGKCSTAAGDAAE